MISTCVAPSNVRLSRAIAPDNNDVLLYWNPGGDGAENYFTYYQISRWESNDGGQTWTNPFIVGTTTRCDISVQPPLDYGVLYHFYVRTVGSAGFDYASPWVACSESLRKGRPTLAAYTDELLEPNQTKVKAIHMLELQNNINTLRVFFGLEAYHFTEIRAGYTGLAGWNGHVEEMREALDTIPTVQDEHEEWLALGDNAPRAEVIMQLRKVVGLV